MLIALAWSVNLMADERGPVGKSGMPGSADARLGDEIVVCGKMFHTGSPVILWMDAGGYDAYRTANDASKAPSTNNNKSLSKTADASKVSSTDDAGKASISADQKVKNAALKAGKRYSSREDAKTLKDEQKRQIIDTGWSLPVLQQVVDQFVLHFDVCGSSKICFKVLNDRNLSVHFMLDLDGTIYQTLDLKERAWHATTSNTRSIGVEIAHIGAYKVDATKHPLDEWYRKDDTGAMRIFLPARFGDPNWRVQNFVPRPRKPEPIVGNIQGQNLKMYDFTPQQYSALAKLTATLCKVFPQIKCDYPRGDDGKLLPRRLADGDLIRYQGVLGHYHVQTNKTDPGPALDWDYLISEAKSAMK